MTPNKSEQSLPGLSPEAARRIADLSPHERHLFVEGAGDLRARLMGLKHFKAYQFALPLAEGREVLDLGCGSGSGSVYLKKNARSVTALDVDPVLMRLLPDIWSEEEVQWQCYDGSLLPFPDSTFDLITSFQVLEHVPDPQGFLLEARRVLRPGGRILATTPNRTFRVAPFQKPWNEHHLKEFWPHALRRVFHQVDFSGAEFFGLRGKWSVMRVEHSLTFRLMLKHLWLKLPGGFRSAVRVPGKPRQSKPKTGDPKSCPPAGGEPLNPDILQWSRTGLYTSLDLMASAIR